MSYYTQQNGGELFPRRVMGQPETYLTANVDGGARGNPGPSGYGVVIKDQSGKRVASLNEYLGHQTNNVAEYQGLIAALEYAIEHGHKALKVISDSELMVKQMKGQYKVKSPGLVDLYHRAKELITKLDWFSIQHVLRAQNREADELANQAMDKGMGRRTQPIATKAQNPVGAGDPAGGVERSREEFDGVVRNGRIELLDGELPEGVRVQVRIRR
jgi:ribonuclease HI